VKDVKDARKYGSRDDVVSPLLNGQRRSPLPSSEEGAQSAARKEYNARLGRSTMVGEEGAQWESIRGKLL